MYLEIPKRSLRRDSPAKAVAGEGIGLEEAERGSEWEATHLLAKALRAPEIAAAMATFRNPKPRQNSEDSFLTLQSLDFLQRSANRELGRTMFFFDGHSIPCITLNRLNIIVFNCKIYLWNIYSFEIITLNLKLN